ncbi:hypothetical protein CBR_g24307 [Chara braunii]|uniref:Core Histone H2A/H2B/H3 domain-containing protein n=1 Tax=Chara braunii TaxID=69332 RepID=A0A388JMD2_CHABU|nr:hypothetical protein CBR_g24307 [Chara braunii]|eukprot:GBG58957.1 hypothetical protein CBR_g24307 [Chara braunii]
METEGILKGFADGSKEGNSVGGNSADCAEVLVTICAQTAEMMGDSDETENDAGGSTCKTETAGEEREEGGLGSRESLTGCIVKDENVVKTSAGEEYPYDINWVRGRVQPGMVGGAPCFAFKVEGTWVPFPAPKKNTWRNVTLAIVFDRLLRLNDGATTEVKARYAMDVWRVLEAQGEFRLNDFLYDSFDCRKAWVIGGNDPTGSTACHESDARRDSRWGWVSCVIPIPCGRVRMMMRDAMGNVWSTHYVNGNFFFRHLDREVSEDEKKAMACNTHTAGCFFPPLRNPVDSEVVEGKVFTGEDDSTYTHARGQEATYDEVCSQIWDHVTMRSDVLSAMDIGARVIPEGQLQQHMAPEKYGYHVNWVPGCLHPAVVDGKVTMAARLQLGHWLPLGWMHAGIVEHWQFLVVLTLVSIFNVNVKDHVLVIEHAKRCWEKIREEERQMVCAGYDSMADQGMWSMVEGSCTAQEHGDGQNRYMARIRRRHGCTTAVGWVSVVCPMTYKHGGDVTMRFRDPLGVPFHLTYSDGLLQDIRYMPEDGLPAQGDMGGPSDVAMSQSPGKKKKCTSGPPRGQTPAGRKKVNPKEVPGTGDTEGARTQIPRRRRRPGMATLSEIRKLPRSTDLCLTFRPFLGLVREVVERDIAPGMGMRFQMTAVRALMEAAEAYLVANFENTNEVTIHSKRVTIQIRDMRLVDRLLKPRWVEKYQDVPVIVADGVEYILLVELVDFMKKSDDNRNIIHEALHEVTEFALQGQDLIEFVPAITEDKIISGRLLWGELLSAALERLGLASCDVERQREREEGWKVMATETNLAIIPDNGQTSAAQKSITSMTVDVPPMQSTTREKLVCCDIFNAFTMEKEQCDRGFEETDLASCCAEYTDSAEEEDEEEDEGASSSDVEVSGSDVSSDEEDEEHDVYYDLKVVGEQVTKGWAHAILRLARAFSDPHKVLRVVMKGATPDGALQYAAVTSIMKSCNKGEKWSRVGKGWFVLVNREVVLATSLTWGVNLRCLIHGAMATAWGETLHPGLSTADTIKRNTTSPYQKSLTGSRTRQQVTREVTVKLPTDILATLTTLMTRTAGAATAQRRTRAVTGQAKTTEARTEEGVPHLREERDARGNPKMAARETQPTRPSLTDN